MSFEPQKTGADALRTAREAYNGARFREALQLLEGHDLNEHTGLLRARILLRIERPVEALETLLAFEPPADPELAAERHILIGAAYGTARDFEAALNEIGRGREHAAPAVVADAIYFTAFTHWLRHDNAAAERELAILRAHADPNERARANVLQAWIEIGRQNVPNHVALLLQALDDFELAGPAANIYFYARALATISNLCREMVLPEVSARLRRVAADFPWTPDLEAEHYGVLRSFGWLDALDGNAISAFRELKEAAAIAPSATSRLLSMLDRAFLAQSMGERSFADDQLGEAMTFARGIKWEDARSDDRVPLLVLAQLTAQVDPAAAVTYLTKFRTLQTIGMAVTLSADPRLNAFMSLSAGIARAGLGDVEEAERLLQDAWSVFEAYGYEWRAALAAHHLFKITGARKWHEIAKTRIRSYPNSWLARIFHENDELIENAPRLTPAQRQVFEALCEGASTLAIAKRLGRSPHTVRNHISDIFEAFGVRSRAELLARLRNG